MKKETFMKTVNAKTRKIGIKLKKHSPEILLVAGLGGAVVSAVMACKATTKLSTIMEESKNNLEAIHKCSEDKEMADTYSVEDAKKDTTIVYVQTGVKLAKLYAPAIAVGIVSATSILAANNIMRKRNVALTAALTTTDQAFKEYRSRVVDKFGEQVDKELKYDIKAKKFEETVTDPETGKEKKSKNTVSIANPGCSEYARFFDETCKGYERETQYNLMFLRAQQQFANDKLVADGFLFLNDVYDMLGIDKTPTGQLVGWKYDELNNDVGDNYVDFGIMETNRETEDGGYEPVILLDFNVDGDILHLI
jgi:hypothetical protein